MESSQKKISFGFSKLKKTNQLKPVAVDSNDVQFVDSFDGERGKFSYQGTRLEAEEKKPLVIPLVGTRTAYDVIKAKLDERAELEEVDVKPSLEVLAAREILSGITNEDAGKEDNKNMVIVTDLEKPTFAGEKESTLEDYENIPVDDFGLAMLRGMGWKPETGIGKDSRVVEPISTEVRPKRLGLGAQCPKPPGERRPMVKGSYVEILAGAHKNSVGMVEGVDGDTGSLFIKLTGGRILSISENWLVGITHKEFERKLNGAVKAEPDQKYGIVTKGETRVDKTTRSQLEQAIRGRKKDKRRKSSSPELRKKKHRSRSRERSHKKSKKRRKSDDDRPRKSKKKHSR